LDVVRNWVKASTNRLVFVENVGRYALYDTDHQVAYSSPLPVSSRLCLMPRENDLYPRDFHA